MGEQLDDPVADGHAWAQRQQSAFPEWVTRYGGGDPGRWDYGLDSLNTLSYLIFDHFPTTESIDAPDNAGFSDPAAWYLGEIIRRSDPKKLCWSRQDYGPDAGDYVVRHTAKTRAWETHNPRAHIRFTPSFGDPLWLRSHYVSYVAPLWDKPWPPWIFASETGSWSWDEASQRWISQRDQWLGSIASLLGVLAALLGDTALDYSTASLEAVEAFTVTSIDTNDAAQVGTLRDAVVAYVGECLLRTGGGRWIWDIHPEHLISGFPVVERNVTRVSPAHLIEFALARRDGQTFARIHRAWIADAEDRRRREDQHSLQRELTPGLDYTPEPTPAEQWASGQRSRFPEWVARYGAGCQWDFSADSLDVIARIVLEHCPADSSVLHAPPGEDFLDGVLWYLGETLHRAKPSRWSFSANVADIGGGWRAGLQISANLPYDVYDIGYPMAVYLVQELDLVVRPRMITGPNQPETNPRRLSDTLESWITATIRERISKSQKRREQAKRRSGSKRSDEETLVRWLDARTRAFPEWQHQFGSASDWDFSIDSLDKLDAVVRQVAAGPEELLEDKANADFVDGAAWYFGEVLRRRHPDDVRWGYERHYHPEPCLLGWFDTIPAEHLATVYTKNGGALRKRYETIRAHREGRTE